MLGMTSDPTAPIRVAYNTNDAIHYTTLDIHKKDISDDAFIATRCCTHGPNEWVSLYIKSIFLSLNCSESTLSFQQLGQEIEFLLKSLYLPATPGVELGMLGMMSDPAAPIRVAYNTNDAIHYTTLYI